MLVFGCFHYRSISAGHGSPQNQSFPDEFAKMLGVSRRTLQEWEQGRRTPSGAAKSLITIAIKKPEMIKELLAV